MTLAISLLLALLSIGILVRGFFSSIMPFDVLKQALRWFPLLAAGRPGLLLLALVPAILIPLGPLLMGGYLPARVAVLAGIVSQGCLVGMLALVALRIHRAVILREKGSLLAFGRRERRMVGYVVAIWLFIMALSSTQFFLTGYLPERVVKGLALLISVATWVVTVATAYVGPSASLDDPRPLSRSWSSVRIQIMGTASLVILSQVIYSATAFAIGAALQAVQSSPAVTAAAVVATSASATIAFVVSETAIVIALTRINENMFDQDTRSRDHNAEWH